MFVCSFYFLTYLVSLLCVCLFFCMVDQKLVIQTKSVEYMPLFLSLASLANSICWTAYALIRFDLYITVSNYNSAGPGHGTRACPPHMYSTIPILCS